MRNFPKQVNRSSKLKNAIAVVNTLLNHNEDIDDDGIYGYALVRAGVYTFPGIDPQNTSALNQRIIQERAKTPGNQGARTAAREIRKTLNLLSFIERDDESWQLSSTGSRLISIPDIPDQEAMVLWRDALIRLKEENVDVHTAWNMMRIVAAKPAIERHWLAFAFDMNDDSDNELNRVINIMNTRSFEDALTDVHATKYVAANAVKVLPSLLKQAGLLSIVDSKCDLTSDGQALLSNTHVGTATANGINAVTRRRPRNGFSVTNPSQVSNVQLTATQNMTIEQQIHKANKLDERTQKHQALVRNTISTLTNVQDLRCSTDAFDLLATSTIDGSVLLFEAKTVVDDGSAQVRAALSQLFFYEYFDVAPIALGAPIIKIAVFDAEPGQDARAFLEHYGVEYIVFLQGGIIVSGNITDYVS